MAATAISRDDLGVGANRLLENRDFKNLLLDDVQGKGVVYKDCDFSYSIIARGYFHAARFERCKFIGTRFVSSIFRSAIFEGCEFSYADFDRSVVPVPQLLANLPAYPNVRWELLHNLRANARSLGDTKHESDLVWREIDTEMEHWRSVFQVRAGYYHKYSRPERVLARLRRWRLLAERYVWGHGESLLRLGVATLVALVALALCNAVGRVADLGSASIGSFASLWADSIGFLFSLYVDLPSVNSNRVSESMVTSTLAVMLRYVSIGLAVPILYKYISKR